MALTKEQQIRRAYKLEIDAAWKAMSKRMDRALTKRDKDLHDLINAKQKAKSND